MRSQYLRVLAVVAAWICFATMPAHSQNLITNGGFESGDFSGWTQIGDTSFSGVCTSDSPSEDCSGRFVFDGDWMGSFGAVFSLGGVKQTIATTPGETYNFTFWLQTGYSAPPNAINVSFDGLTVLSATDMGHVPWTQYSFTKVASGTSADVVFQFYSVLDYYDLDDVSVEVAPVAETPEPTSLLLLSTSALGLGEWRRRR